jgi:hypothetical protein
LGFRRRLLILGCFAGYCRMARDAGQKWRKPAITGL